MSFASGFTSASYELLFENCEDAKISRENWGVSPPVVPTQNESQKRRKSTSVTAKKRAKMTRGDENINDETAKEAARTLLDQIQDTPGQISLDSGSVEAAGVCPLPPSMSQAVASQWTIKQLEEGQLSKLLAEDSTRFKSLGIQKLQKGAVHTQILPRQLNLKETIANLRNEKKESDQYVGFAVAIASVLRRCDAETSTKIAQSIIESIEKDASIVLNRV